MRPMNNAKKYSGSMNSKKNKLNSEIIYNFHLYPNRDLFLFRLKTSLFAGFSSSILFHLSFSYFFFSFFLFLLLFLLKLSLSLKKKKKKVVVVNGFGPWFSMLWWWWWILGHGFGVLWWWCCGGSRWVCSLSKSWW